MPFDWEKAAQEDKNREQRIMRVIGTGYIAVGITSTLAHFAIGHPEDLSSGLIMGSIGVASLVVGLVMQHRQRAAAPPTE